MKEIKNKELFGATLQSLEDENITVKIIEVNEEITEGIVDGYSKGYELKGKIVPAAVGINDGENKCRIFIQNIEQLFIEK